MFWKTLSFTVVVAVLCACASEPGYPRYRAWEPTPTAAPAAVDVRQRDLNYSASEGRPGVDTAQLRMERERALMRSQAESQGIRQFRPTAE